MSDIVFPLHIVSLVWAFTHIAYADHLGLLWIRGTRDTLTSGTIRYLHYAVFAGLVGLVLTGTLLFWPTREYLLSQSPAFALKMGFVVALIFNSFAIGALSRIASLKSAKELTRGEAVPLVVSGALSGLSWLGAFVSAFFLYG